MIILYLLLTFICDTSAVLPAPIFINIGGPSVTHNGTFWEADRDIISKQLNGEFIAQSISILTTSRSDYSLSINVDLLPLYYNTTRFPEVQSLPPYLRSKRIGMKQPTAHESRIFGVLADHIGYIYFKIHIYYPVDYTELHDFYPKFIVKDEYAVNGARVQAGRAYTLEFIVYSDFEDIFLKMIGHVLINGIEVHLVEANDKRNLCDINYYPSNNLCVPCPVGTIKQLVGNYSCLTSPYIVSTSLTNSSIVPSGLISIDFKFSEYITVKIPFHMNFIVTVQTTDGKRSHAVRTIAMRNVLRVWFHGVANREYIIHVGHEFILGQSSLLYWSGIPYDKLHIRTATDVALVHTHQSDYCFYQNDTCDDNERIEMKLDGDGTWTIEDYNLTMKSWHDTLLSTKKQTNSFCILDRSFCGVLTNGSLVCLGQDYVTSQYPSGQFLSVVCGGYFACALGIDNVAKCFGLPSLGRTIVPAHERFIAIGTGSSHACGLRTNLTIVCWGEIYADAYFTTKNLDTSQRYISLSCGHWHCCAVTILGKVHCFGENTTNKLDVPSDLPPAYYTSNGFDHSCAMVNGVVNGSNVVCWGENIGHPPKIIFGTFNSGSKHACGLDLQGYSHCWGIGSNYDSVMGANPNTFTKSYAALDVAADRICFMKTDGAMKCVTGTGPGDSLYFDQNEISLFVPYRESIGLYVRCFTDVGHAQCDGYDQNSQANLPAGVEFVQLATGALHTCGLTEMGFIKCFGFNFYKQVDETPMNGGFVGIASGSFHVCGIFANLSVTCWGSNRNGESDIPISLKFVQLALGYFYSCGLTDYGELLCFGSKNRSTNYIHDYHGEATVPDYLGYDRISISAALQHTCTLLFSGKAQCFGWDSYGQSSPPPNETYVSVEAVDGISSIGGATCLTTITNKWFCIGSEEVLRTIRRSGPVNQFLNNQMYLTYVQFDASKEKSCILQKSTNEPDEMEPCTLREFDSSSSEGSVILMLAPGTYDLVDYLWRDGAVIHVMPVPSATGPVILKCISLACLSISKARVIFQDIIFDFYGDSSISVDIRSLAIFRNCIFRGQVNAYTMLVVHGLSSLVLQNCIFQNGNSIEGGAIVSSSSSVYAINSKFENFQASTVGGVMKCSELSGCILNNCLVFNNKANSGGSAIYTSRGVLGSYLTTWKSNTVNDNIDSTGGTIGSLLSFVYIRKNEFLFDEAPQGSSIYSELSSFYVFDSKFLNSTSGINSISSINDKICTSMKPGGSIFSSDSHIELYNSYFVNNSAINSCGGAIYMSNGLLELHQTEFYNNLALFGGALCFESTNSYSKYYLHNSRISINIALSSGGGIFSNNIFGELYHSQIYNNIAYQDGAGIYMNEGRLNLYNISTIQYNTAKYGGGGGIYSQHQYLQTSAMNPKLPILTSINSKVANNTQFYGKDITSGPYKIYLREKPDRGNIRFDFTPDFEACVIDTNNQLVYVSPFYQNIADGFNLQLIIEADLTVNTSVAQLVGTTKRDLTYTGCSKYIGLQYSGLSDPNVKFRFSSDIAQYQRTLKLEEIAVVTIHPCKAGSEYVPEQGVCQVCSPGYYSSFDGDACQKCGVGRVASKHETQNCSICEPPYFQNKIGGIECETCQAGTYALCSENKCSGECSTCPEGAICEGGIVTSQSNIWLYSSKNGEVETYLCSRCLPNNQCEAGRKQPASENPLCGECLPGKSEWGGDCLDCDGVSWLVFVMFFAMLILVLLVHIDSQISTAPAKIFVYYVQICAVMVTSVYLDWLRFFNFSILNAPSRGQCLFPVSQTDRLWIGFVTPLVAFGQLGAILLTHYIIAVMFCKNQRRAIEVNRRRPSVMEMAQLENNPKSFVVTDQTLIMPWEIITTHRNSISLRRALDIPLFGAIIPLTSYIRSLFGLFLFSYNAILGTLFEFFDCTKVGSTRYVTSNPAVSCESDSYEKLYPLMMILTLICLIIIPGSFAYLLFSYWKRHLLRTRKVRKWLGVLYESFDHESFYWQLVIIARRTILVAIAVFVDDLNFKQSLLTSFNFITLLLHIKIQPYGEYYDNIFESISLGFLTVIAANLREPITESNAIFLSFIVILGFIIQTVRILLVKFGKMQYPSTKAAKQHYEFDGVQNINDQNGSSSSRHYIVRPPMTE